MENLLVKIYQLVISDECDSNNLGEKYDNKIEDSLVGLNEQLEESDIEKVRELLYEVAYVTEQGGFMLGVRFMASFMNEIMSKEIQIIDNSQS